ncbi:MAG: long-chain-fatty-acid--CoA ligase [Planctomycetota bacterium]|nr:long-chain-fatty-acid--CoA ligase [Planctomycetota bacterium]
MERKQVSHSPLTPLSFLERSRAVYPEKTAVVYGERRITYREFADRVHRLASALRDSGLEKGDRVAFLSPNTPPMLEAHFAVPLAGGVLVTINIRLLEEEVAYILNHSGARFLFIDTCFSDRVKSTLGELASLESVIELDDPAKDAPGESLDVPDYESFLRKGRPDPLAWWLEGEEDSLSINYTSGTTGKPKGVLFTHRGAYLNALGEVIEMGLSSDSVYLWTVPMFHCNGWCFTWAVTAVGGTHVCIRRVDPGEVWELIREAGVTHLSGAPVVMNSLIHHPGRPERLERPLTVTTGGAPPSPTLIEHMEKLNARLLHIYGLTETYGPHTLCARQAEWDGLPLEEKARRKARQGVCYAVTDPVRVVDDDMNDVPRDGETLGEVVMRGNNVMKGYYREPEATDKAFRGGWFHSGDVAVMHPDGYIELRDRSKDIIISGGENVSSIEVEQALYRHPAVLEVAVIGIPHEKWGETPKAFVTLKDGCQVGADELIAFSRERLAHFKCPTVVEFAEIPKTSTGKIQKYVLREKEWSGEDKRIRG